MHRSVRLAGMALVATLTACGTQLKDSRFAPTVVLGQDDVAQQGAGAAQASAGAEAQSAAPGDQDPASAPVGAAPGPAAAVQSQATAPVVGAPTRAAAASAARTTATKPKPGASAKPSGVGALGASDVGVTAKTITVGNLVSQGGIFGTEQFAVSKYGVLAFFKDLNTHGGINGRQVLVNTYNDSGDGSQDVTQVNQAISDKVFALVGNNVYAYDGAGQLQASGTPDIGGQPIANPYYKYSHLFTILGTNVPRNNKDLGYGGSNYGTDEAGLFYKEKVGSKNVGIVYYDQAESQRGAAVFGQSFSVAGLSVKMYPVNLGLPNFPNTVAQMQSDGIDTVADAMDSNGNAKLCQAMESNSSFLSQVKAKISTIAAWSQRIPTEFKQTKNCRNLIYVTGSSRNYADTSNPEVGAFRAAMKKYFSSRESLMAQWSFEGWLAGEVFTEAAKSCGANLTRACVEAYLNKPGRVLDYGHATTGFSWYSEPESDYGGGATRRACLSVARWSDTAGTFVTVGDPASTCYTATYYKYEIT